MNERLQLLKSFIYRLPWFSRRRQISLLMRLMVVACAWGTIIFGLAVLGLWWTANQVIADNIRRQSIQLLNRFDELGTPLFVSGNPSTFEPIRRNIENFPEIAFLRYVAADGTKELGRYLAPDTDNAAIIPFTRDDLALLNKIVSNEKSRLLVDLPGADIMRATAPAVIRSIPSDGLLSFSLDQQTPEQLKVIGYIDIGINFSAYRDHLWQRILYGSLLILGLFVLTFTVGRLVILQALRPLVDLQIPLDRLARGETDIEVESHGATEIAAISNALNVTIAAIKERDQELKRLANFDTLTGLLNRHSFNRELAKEKARTLLAENTSALLFIDLDRFKEVNDIAGHAAGDELLIQVGRLLRATVRNSDVVARLGGDEFTIILINVNTEDAARIAEQICAAMRQFTFSADGHNFSILCSVGITMIDSSHSSFSTILSQADTACHEAKKTGRNGFRFYHDLDVDTPLHQEVGTRAQIEGALAGEGDLSLHFMPVRDREEGEGHFYEALLRMQIGGETIPAGAFISSAERFNLVQRLDFRVIELALEALQKAPRPVSLSINISGLTIVEEGITAHLAHALRTSGVEAQRLSFEVAERTVLDNVTQTKNFMVEIKELGCGVIIDDFGTSLNSINLLRNLPVDQLKICGTLIDDLSSSFNRSIVTSIVQISRSLGIRTVAKNVARTVDAELLLQIGVDRLQGHHVGHPLTKIPPAGGQSDV